MKIEGESLQITREAEKCSPLSPGRGGHGFSESLAGLWPLCFACHSSQHTGFSSLLSACSVPRGELTSHRVLYPSLVPANATVHAQIHIMNPKARKHTTVPLAAIMTMLGNHRAIHSCDKASLSNYCVAGSVPSSGEYGGK